MKTKKFIKRGVEYTVKTNDKIIKVNKLGDNSSLKVKKREKKDKQDIIDLNIKKIKLKDVDKWVDDNISNIEDVKNILKDLIKLNCDSPRTEYISQDPKQIKIKRRTEPNKKSRTNNT